MKWSCLATSLALNSSTLNVFNNVALVGHAITAANSGTLNGTGVVVFDGTSDTISAAGGGSFVIGNGETNKINETGQPGVRLVNDVGLDAVRHFHAGKGEGVILATDPSGNVGIAMCR